jgi:hypothetical protein
MSLTDEAVIGGPSDTSGIIQAGSHDPLLASAEDSAIPEENMT